MALIRDVQEMYLQIKLRPEDQPYHHFLWRDVQSDREPGVSEFDRVVFGVNSSRFQAQFVGLEYVRRILFWNARTWITAWTPFRMSRPV